jgi:ammonium transporter, Amt family
MSLVSFLPLLLLLISTTSFISAAGSCPENNINFGNGTCFPCEWYQYPAADFTCAMYSDIAEKMAGDHGKTIDAANTGYMLCASALVLVMTPALALFYGGLSTEGNVMNTVLLSLVSMSIITVVWCLLGYSIAFGPGGEFWGNAAWGVLTGVAAEPSGVYGLNIPHALFCAFQLMFAQITPALISGAIVGRMTFLSYCIFIGAWSLVVYSPLARWCWSFTLNESGAVVPNGWLGKLGVLDYAGGTPIHTAAGFSALACSLVVGARLVKKESKIDTTKLLSGVGLLWFGWCAGFNAGSTGGVTGQTVIAFLNSHIANCVAVLVWMIAEYIHTGKATFIGACTAAVIGLVAITPGCGFVSLMSSMGVGGITSLLCYLFNIFKTKYMSEYLDDTLDVFLCHGVAGFIGTVMTGFFAEAKIGNTNGAFFGNPRQIGIQLAAVTTSAVYSFSVSVVLLLMLKYTVGIRVAEDLEMNGLDSAHAAADEDDSIFAPKDEDKPLCIIFTDIEKSTKLWARSHATMTRCLDMHNNAIKRIVKRLDMYVCKIIGDAFMVATHDPVKAVRFCLDVQQELYDLDWNAPDFDACYTRWRELDFQNKGDGNSSQGALGGGTENSQKSGTKGHTVKTHQTNKDPLWHGLRVRVGAHYGMANIGYDGLTKRFDYFGTTVNCAARCEQVGHGGQCIITEQLWTAAKQKDPKITGELVNVNIGHTFLKGIRDPADLFQILPVKLSARRFPPLRAPKGVDHADGGSAAGQLVHSASRSLVKGSVDRSENDVYQHNPNDSESMPGAMMSTEENGVSFHDNASFHQLYNNSSGAMFPVANQSHPGSFKYSRSNAGMYALNQESGNAGRSGQHPLPTPGGGSTVIPVADVSGSGNRRRGHSFDRSETRTTNTPPHLRGGGEFPSQVSSANPPPPNGLTQTAPHHENSNVVVTVPPPSTQIVSGGGFIAANRYAVHNDIHEEEIE